MSLKSLNSFCYAPMAFGMHVLYQMLTQGRGAYHPVPRKIVSRDSGVLDPHQDFTSRGSSLSGKVHEFELLGP